MLHSSDAQHIARSTQHTQPRAHLVAGQAQRCLNVAQLPLLQAQREQDGGLAVRERRWQLGGQVEARE